MPYKEESSVNKPISPYAASKKAAELIAYTYHHQFKIDVSIVRYFTVYGPSGRPDMSVLRFIKWIDEEKPIILICRTGRRTKIIAEMMDKKLDNIIYNAEDGITSWIDAKLPIIKLKR